MNQKQLKNAVEHCFAYWYLREGFDMWMQEDGDPETQLTFAFGKILDKPYWGKYFCKLQKRIKKKYSKIYQELLEFVIRIYNCMPDSDYEYELLMDSFIIQKAIETDPIYKKITIYLCNDLADYDLDLYKNVKGVKYVKEKPEKTNYDYFLGK